jgi:hypothetical protein
VRKSYLIAGLSVFAALFACGDDEGGNNENSTVAATCARVCQRSNAANCAADVKDDCISECVQNVNQLVPRACSAQLDTLNACTVKASFVCDADNTAQPVGCDSQINALGACLQQNGGGTPGGNGGGNDAGTQPVGNDAGTQPRPDAGPVADAGGGKDGGLPGALLCTPEASDDSCDTCGKTSCCAEYSACGAECQALSLCVADCFDDTCVQSCLNAHPTGTDAVLAIADCLDTECTDECADEEENALCLTTTVPPTYCTDPKRPLGLDCPGGVPEGDCVLSSSGAANVYCCAQ